MPQIEHILHFVNSRFAMWYIMANDNLNPACVGTGSASSDNWKVLYTGVYYSTLLTDDNHNGDWLSVFEVALNAFQVRKL